ncbi:major facilitator superfamily domain-containing protein [Xylaria intraflava]|nr:major facilitator superfamily domain-containing protein [Xylaria intraflava]
MVSLTEHDAIVFGDGDRPNAQPIIGNPPTPEEALALRKLDRRLLPLAFVSFSLFLVDATNLANVHAAGLDESIGLEGNQYSMLGTVFHLSLLIFQGAAAGWKHFPAHAWVRLAVLSFTTVSASQAAAQNYAGMLVLRFLLGVYLSFFYPRDRVGFRQGIYISGALLAHAYSAALAYAITQIRSHIEPWRILFLIESLRGLILVVVTWFYWPDDIESATFLSHRDKEAVKHMVNRGQTADVVAHRVLRVQDFWAAFTDWRCYLIGIIAFGCQVCITALALFVPAIISKIGNFTGPRANGLSVPPYLLAFILTIIFTFISDRIKRRGLLICCFSILSAVGFLLLATTEAVSPRYVGVYLAVIVHVGSAILAPWATNIHNTESRRAGGWAILGMMGQTGALLGTNLFPSNEVPYYRKGSWVSFSICLLVAIVSAILSLLLHRENRRLDKAQLHSIDEETDMRRFRYII